MKCTGINRDLSQCKLEALPGKQFCFSHDQTSRRVYRAEVFTLAPEEVDDRIRRLTPKQLEALEYFAGGHTYQSAGVILGINQVSFTNRVSVAIRRAGVQSRLQLMCLYAMWRAAKRESQIPTFPVYQNQ